jgi:intein/homing endonuclease
MLAGHSTSKVSVTTKWDGCVHEDTIILTNNGDMTIREIVERKELWGELEIMGKNLKSSPEYDGLNLLLAGNSSDGDKSWVELQLEDGSSIKLTEDHEVHTTNRGWVKAIELNEGDDISEL